MVTHTMLLTVKFNSLSSDKIWKQALPVKLLTRKFAWKSTKLLLQDAISRSGFIWIFQSCLNLKKKCFPPNNQVVAISNTKKCKIRKEIWKTTVCPKPPGDRDPKHHNSSTYWRTWPRNSLKSYKYKKTHKIPTDSWIEPGSWLNFSWNLESQNSWQCQSGCSMLYFIFYS